MKAAEMAREAMERTLRESEERFRRLSEAAFKGIAVHDDDRIIDVNDTLAAMFGYCRDEMIGKHPLEFVASEARDTASVRRADWEPFELACSKKDGSGFRAEVWQKRVRWGKRELLVTAIRDLTLRRQADEAIRAFSRRLVETQEAERQRIARELHDQTGQMLTGLKLLLQMAARLPTEDVRRTLAEAEGLVNDVMRHVHSMSLDLRPAILDDLGLLPALGWQFGQFTGQTSISVNFRHNGLDRRLIPEVELAAFRIVQEALTNVARHAGVSEVAVRLWLDDGRLYAHVEDRGIGFDPGAACARGHTGLAGMNERVLSLGGQLRVESAPGDGTSVLAELPISRSEEAGR
jgi:PAS domain S-box-containing protein